AEKNPVSFPDDARQIMNSLTQKYPVEISLFAALERLDYIIYAIEQYIDRGHSDILLEVLYRSMPHVDAYAKTIPGFTETVWTDAFRDWALSLLTEAQTAVFA
ncbi:MAG TPA: hypothetical protein VFQ60_04620, partial [Patescibacteria group bacterium]|nr:hypothetical protein [Patescibacteria group bacterium]